MDAKTLRALAKAAGLKPMVFFRLSPEQVLEAVKEHNPEVYKDLETWPNEVAIAHMGTLAIDKGKDLVKEKEEEPVKKSSTEEVEAGEEDKPAKKKTTRRRTSKKKEEDVAKSPAKEPKTERTIPSKKRPKKKGGSSGPVTPKVAFSADMEEVKARMELLEDQIVAARTMISELTAMNREMMLFFTWWHNKYLNEDAEPEILGIDWEACINEQINEL